MRAQLATDAAFMQVDSFMYLGTPSEASLGSSKLWRNTVSRGHAESSDVVIELTYQMLQVGRPACEGQVSCPWLGVDRNAGGIPIPMFCSLFLNAMANAIRTPFLHSTDWIRPFVQAQELVQYSLTLMTSTWISFASLARRRVVTTRYVLRGAASQLLGNRIVF